MELEAETKQTENQLKQFEEEKIKQLEYNLN